MGFSVKCGACCRAVFALVSLQRYIFPVSAPFGRGQTMHSLGCFAAAYVFATSEFRGEGCVCMLSVVLQILQRVQSYAARKIVRIGKDEHMSACAA